MTHKIKIEKNLNNVWTAVVTFAGFPSIGKAFHKKEEAENFVKEMTQ